MQTGTINKLSSVSKEVSSQGQLQSRELERVKCLAQGHFSKLGCWFIRMFVHYSTALEIVSLPKNDLLSRATSGPWRPFYSAV